MKTFEYKIKSENGIHARPAGVLVKEASKYKSDIMISTVDGKESSAKKLFAIMKLGVRQGDTITVTSLGVDEEEASKAISTFFLSNF